jgi:hypothetical protein
MTDAGVGSHFTTPAERATGSLPNRIGATGSGSRRTALELEDVGVEWPPAQPTTKRKPMVDHLLPGSISSRTRISPSYVRGWRILEP